MKNCILVLLATILTLVTSAQKVKFYTVQAGQSLIEAIPASETYAYPEFQEGIVNFKGGTSSSVKLNYSYAYQEMMFINAQGDTLIITNPEEIKNIIIGATQFYYSKERFVKIDTTIGNVKLASTGFFGIVSKRLAGSYGTTVDGSTLFTNYIRPSDAILELSPNAVTTVAYKEAVFIGDRFNRFVPAKKRSVSSLYTAKRRQLKKYLQSNTVNFSLREDVISLIVHMNKL